MSPKIKKHFVFDLDDTIVDGRLFCGQTMARSITKYEPNIDGNAVVEFHDNTHGLAIVDLYKEAIQRFGLKTPIEKLLATDAEIMLSESGEKIKSFDGVIDILEILKEKGKHLHICTNRKSDSLIPILKNNKLYDYFDNVISCVDQGHKKPDPTCLKKLIEETKDTKEAFIYFGDSEVDYLFARNAEIEYIIFDQYLNGKTLFNKLISVFLE